MRNTEFVKQVRGDLYWQSNLTHCWRQANLLILTPKPPIDIVAQEIVLQRHKERVERFPHPDRLLNAGFLENSSRAIFHDKAH